MSSSKSALNEDVIRSIVKNTSVPVVLRGKIANWPLCEWSLEKWKETFGRREYPFRCFKKCIHSDRPRWERKCSIKQMRFKDFTEAASCSDETMYFDYKYLHQWFSEDDELCKAIHWEQFGFVNKKPCDTTLWVGSAGAHTAAHQDTYGVNIVVQVYGKKRWILFPPESGGLRPTRVPYEESSVYSDLNFYCPTNVQVFKGLTGGRVTELSAGDALVVPHKWWHYVQNEDPVNISLNMWLPHENDDSSRMSEAVIKMFVTQLCKDLSPEQVKSVVNPTEDDFTDASLQDLLFQLQDTSEECLDKKRKTQRLKRQRTDDVEPSPDSLEYDLDALLSNPSNKMETPPIVTGEELIRLLEDNKSRYCKVSLWSQIGEETDENPILRLIKPVINSFCQANVVDQFKQNLLSHLPSSET